VDPTRRATLRLLLAPLVLFALILGFVFATGQTFGQRCAIRFEVNSPEWATCVDDLAAPALPDCANNEGRLAGVPIAPRVAEPRPISEAEWQEERRRIIEFIDSFDWTLPMYADRARNEASDDAAESVKGQIYEALLALPPPPATGESGTKGDPHEAEPK